LSRIEIFIRTGTPHPRVILLSLTCKGMLESAGEYLLVEVNLNESALRVIVILIFRPSLLGVLISSQR
jgi:hypothetical protein